MTVQEIAKNLKTERIRLRSAKELVVAAQQAQNSKERQVRKLEQELEAAKNKGTVFVSDHAIVRLWERKYKLDINQTKSEILTPKIAKQAEILGGTGAFIDGDCEVRMEDYVITTVIWNNK
ncbi:MAG: hypothetical protein ACRBG0_27650 [Lewinella sp.]|uniref:hypothetical protein n=1 Tax=Lewinella sp. TaxID=2004506 RepID=UPI003D6AB297